jgi:hypothetical protein
MSQAVFSATATSSGFDTDGIEGAHLITPPDVDAICIDLPSATNRGVDDRFFPTTV